MPKISVILAVYNVEPYLRKSLDCLVNQTFTDLEFICVDDCSTDGSLEILKEYASKDSRFKIIESDVNGGAAVARNKGLDVATGEYLGFIDSDDTIDLNYYEKLYEKAVETNADIVKCERKEVYYNGKVKYSSLNKKIEKNKYHFTYEWTTAIYKASIIYDNDIRFPSECTKAQDVVFLNRIMLKAKTLELISGVYYYYQKRNDSLNACTIPLKSIKSACRARIIMAEDLNKSRLLQEDKKQYIENYKHIISTVYYTMFQNNTAEARTCCAKNFIDLYELCQDKKFFEKKYPYPLFIKYSKENDVEKLSEIFINLKTQDEIFEKFSNPYFSFLQKIFSIRNSYNKKYKIIHILGFRINYERIFKKNDKRIYKRLETAKYVHIMHNDKFNKPLVDFLNRNFNTKEHLVLCKEKYDQFPMPVGDNVFTLETMSGLKFKKHQKIICHSLFNRELINYLYRHKNVLKNQAYWCIWGGDLYNAKRDMVNDYVRSHFKGYLINFDRFYLEKKYKIKGNYFEIMTPFPISIKMLESLPEQPHDYIQIQINNSSDDSTIEMLDTLSKFKDENIKITTILSYGKTEYNSDIIKKGKEIFGDKFEPILDYLTPDEYAKHMNSNDILLLCQHRQQGWGNTVASLILGKKVFMRESILHDWEKENWGLTIYNTEDIDSLSFEEFIQNNKVEENKETTKKIMSEEYIAKLWKKVFDAK